MSNRIEAFAVTIPKATAKASPLTVPTTFPEGVVTAIEIDIPPGPSGLLGFMIAHSSQQIIPRTANSWITLDDRNLSWTLSDYPTGGAWAVIGYNTDIYNHTIQVRYLINELSEPAPQPITILPIG